MPGVKTLTLRLSESEYTEARQLADQSSKSLNQLAKDGLAQLAREAKRQRLYDEFTEIGEDADDTSVEFAVDAQTETLD